MANNILRAILNIAAFGNNDLRSYASTYLNRINAVGEQLEFYIKDAVATSFTVEVGSRIMGLSEGDFPGSLV